MKKNALFSFLKQYNEYRILKSDPEKKKASKYYGVKSIILSVMTIVFSLTAFLYNPSLLQENVLIGLFMLLLLFSLSLIAPLISFSQSLVSAIFQMRINKKHIGWISLVISILSAITAILLLLFIFSAL